MRVQNVILSGYVFEKCEPSEYRGIDGKPATAYPVIIKVGDIAPTFRLTDENLYKSITEGKRYAFFCSVNTESEYESSRFKITGLASSLAIEKNDDFVVVSRNESYSAKVGKPVSDK